MSVGRRLDGLVRCFMATPTLFAGLLFINLFVYPPSANSFVTKGSGSSIGCSFHVNGDLPDPQPLILRGHQNWSTPKFRYPDRGDELLLHDGEPLRLTCTDSRFVTLPRSKRTFRPPAEPSERSPTSIQVQCVGGQVVRADDWEAPLEKLACEEPVASVAVPKGACPGVQHGARYTHVDIGVVTAQDVVLPVLEICFDQDKLDPVFSRCTIEPSIAGSQKQVPRPTFTSGSLYGSTDVNRLYSRTNQRRTLGLLLKSQKLAEKYIRSKGDYYLARGHLVAKADLVYESQQRATFQLMNAAPQWQTMNGGNWQRVEACVRAVAVQRGMALDVITGIWGTAALPDSDGVLQPLYLLVAGPRRGVRVPLFFWKSVYHPESQAGIVIVSVNNPYRAQPRDDVFCEDVCDRLEAWLHLPRRKSQEDGYTFCCEVNDFRRTVTTLPDFPVRSLLT